MLDTGLDTLIMYNPWTLAPATSLAEAARLLDETGVSQWPIVDDEGALRGVLSASALAAGLDRDPSGGTSLEPLIDTGAGALELGTGPLVALEQMLAGGRRMLPVTDAGRVVGTLSSADFLRELPFGGGRIAKELIIEHMHKQAESIDSDATLEQAHAAFAAGATHLVVVQGDFPLGALTPASLAVARVQQFARRLRGSASGHRTLGQLLQSAPTIPPGRTLGEAASLLVEHQLDAVAVANQAAHLLGVVTEDNILQAMLQS